MTRKKKRRKRYKRVSADDLYKARARAEAAHIRWQKATPAILKAIAAKVKRTPVNGLLSTLVLRQVSPYGRAPREARLVPRGTSAQALIRRAAFIVLCNEARGWGARERFPRRAAALGVKTRAIVDKVAPREKKRG